MSSTSSLVFFFFSRYAIPFFSLSSAPSFPTSPTLFSSNAVGFRVPPPTLERLQWTSTAIPLIQNAALLTFSQSPFVRFLESRRHRRRTAFPHTSCPAHFSCRPKYFHRVRRPFFLSCVNHLSSCPSITLCSPCYPPSGLLLLVTTFGRACG
jgi:hypothetical protein